MIIKSTILYFLLSMTVFKSVRCSLNRCMSILISVEMKSSGAAIFDLDLVIKGAVTVE